ncbi:hypothetical protein MCAP1_003004 [Malassezia caprae]|uniref:Uncharacterized protein n=1 Tax=Malassezia caprae TaxID=1381934 RepID=A0AAF0IWL2_9BASI|nr:hypothetical protein MCAP1_003004 [Malassezia caprae]
MPVHNMVRHARTVLAAHGFELAEPHPLYLQDRKLNALWRQFLCWDATDNGLQAVRFALLLLHVYARLRPPRSTFHAIARPISYTLTHVLSQQRRIALGRSLLIASEGVANVRRLALLALWMLTCFKELSMRWRAANENHPVPHEPMPLEERAAIGGEIVAHLGESFDVAAFFTGSGLFWRAFGLPVTSELPPWLQRRRRGLERIGVFVSLAALALQQYALHLRRLSIRRQIHSSIHLMQQELLPMAGEALEEHKSRDEALERHRRVQEQYALLVAERRRMRWLNIERICLYSDTLFTTVEALAPDEDKEMLEAGTGLVAAVLRLLRLWNEVRFGSLDL